ncbi:thymidylate synthase [Candidatus Woesebacteria bacterium RIFCSPLOWO2_01_FULL_39_23]|uniref:Thymidylate synthase n=1 Tax=Candidatus Woesebacteria bacterium RIFCSPHIGHO2_01_FULL_40_22 TaxID=1802499 RepID=A0A1F7YJY9_9BACT|nr:MAG: thymidylate synthase [Candidatus Woesebacteria bacterium RBG_16_40_11]OGM26918.1 MAG: thymidylate synthase [Candidatus Woesebacteria bacterium RIFCSPHIGHO2_01_FULL_40_22]OGM37328.1 MAG: thymidylate synthase [Candidatus Woesebacteria bacterium RIFCSPHIGHO2_12_FULL_38_9]OGM63193.1 MAG: thymidylate synthase [Candidatus Woesebacteria bacterium RIFCSPLOWO2_01_FULL_39_23]
MIPYLNLLQDILDNGVVEKSERTGTGTKKVFGRQLRFDLSQGFPLLTTKKMFMKGVIYELLWFISGNSNIRYLVKNDVNIWNEWPYQNYLKAKGLEKRYLTYTKKWQKEKERFIQKIITDEKFAEKYGDCGPFYGVQWRNFSGVDQLSRVVSEIKKNPASRRLIVNAWNAPLISRMALPPCHVMYQFQVSKEKLSCMMYQRSVDTFLGLPFNIASYALLTMMVAQVTNNKPGDLVLALADTHLYLNHIELAKEQLKRKPYKLPKMKINPKVNSVFRFRYEDFELKNYKFYPTIKAQISV